VEAVKSKILIVDDQPARRRMLVGLIAEQIEAMICLEADSADSASKALEHQPVDFAIVEISPHPAGRCGLAETIKLRCPMLPVLAVSTERYSLKSVDKNREIAPEQSDRILAGIRYMDSLRKSGLLGFTVVVDL